MIPHEPPKQPQYGFLFFPPYRVQGYSIAGEETFVQVPELDICFDVGRASRMMLTSGYVALTHGHMDHAAGLAYYFSQRHFQGMGTGTVLCHAALAEPIRRLMAAWIDIEAQRTPHRIIAMSPGDATAEFEIKNHIYLRCFATDHTVPSLGFVIVEKRSKLKDEYAHLLQQPGGQDKLVELKNAGAEITYLREVPLIAYMGDTGPSAAFEREDVLNAKVLITECTFIDADHRERAKIGKHLHVTDLARLLTNTRNEAVVLTHLSRRTHMGEARSTILKTLPANLRDRAFILMDGRTNRLRYDQQLQRAEAAAGPAPAAPTHPADEE
jgi:ribonuclease Z